MSKRVLLTDFPWPDVDIERQILADAAAELVVAADSSEATLVEQAADVDAIMTTWAAVTRPIIAAAKNCRIVSRMGIGLDNIDIAYCTERGIPVTNVPDYCAIEVAEHALALIMSLARKVAHFHRQTKQGHYNLQSGPPLRRLTGQVLGIVGYGNSGSKLAELASAMGLRVIVATRTNPRDSPDTIRFCGLSDLLGESDFVSLHLPLSDQTRHLINETSLALMKPTAYLVNTSRGGIVDHGALAAALESGRLAGAALDVQDPEPPDLSQRPYNDERVIVTPHAAFASTESVRALRTRATTQVATMLKGQRPDNVVN